MIRDLAKDEQPSQLDCDLAIVGSGPAGMSIALACIDSGLSVVLIESGGLEAETVSRSLNQGKNIGQGYYPLDRARSRHLGGSSNCWAGWCAPLDKSDFESHDWIPKSGWPISYQEVTKYYPEAGRRLELDDRPFETKPWARKKAPVWQLGDGFESAVYKFSPPTRFGTRYRPQLLVAKSLTCLINATVTQIDVAPQGNRITGLRVQHTQGNRKVHVVARRYVLATGGIENARLLLASRKTLPKGIGNTHDNVGRYFMEHPHLHSEGRFYRTQAMPPIKLYTRHKHQGQIIKAYVRIPEHLRKEKQLLNLALCIEPVHRTKLSSIHRDLIEATAETDGQTLAMDKKKQPKLMSCDLRAEQVPNYNSRVILADDSDHLGVPRIQLDWKLTAIDKASMRRTQSYFAKRLMIKGWSRFLLRLDESEAFPKRLKGGCHHMGTTRMADKADDGVVDSDGRVFGVDNLFVAGSSTFPTGGASNPTLTIVALALRMADRLKVELS